MAQGSRSQASREYELRRRATKPWRKWYTTPQWQSLRANQLSKQPLCERCLSRGIVTRATVAHHIEPHKGNPTLFYNPANLASSCKSCHDIDEQRIEKGGKARQQPGPDGWPLD